MTAKQSTAALAIAGFGPVGAACAIACSLRLANEEKIVILDGQQAALSVDPRMIAISEGSRRILQRLGAWDERVASPITEIHVSQRGSFGRTLIAASDYRIPALGYVIAYHELAGMLQRRVAALGVEVRQARIGAITETTASDDAAGALALALDDGTSVTAQFVVHAEGGTYGQQTAKPVTRPYQQHALSALLTASHLVPARAYERFTVHGPIALLPTRCNDTPCYALVWCAKPADCERRMHLDDEQFLNELRREFGGRVGNFTSVGKRTSFPLGLNVRTSWPHGREFGIGNASQTLHPVAGQGFNLGLRDALQLSEVLSSPLTDPARTAQIFAATRRMDRFATVGVTDFLPRIFGLSAPFAGAARGTALVLLDLIAPLRHPVAKQMMYGRR